MLVFWRTDTAVHGGMRGGEQEISVLASMGRACAEAILADSSLVQSFSNAVHPQWRSYDQKVAHLFRAEDDDQEPRSPLIVP